MWDVNAGEATVRGIRKKRAASFRARPQGVQSLRGGAADAAALARDSRVGAKAPGDISGAQ